MKIAARLKTIEEYVFSDLAKRKYDVEKRKRNKVLDLSIGSPDIPPSPAYVKKLSEFIQDKESHLYPGYGAMPEFKAALKNWYKRRFGVEINEEAVLPLLGAKEGVSYLPLALLDKDSEVLIPDPGYPAFSGPAKLVGASLVSYKASHGTDVDELKKKATERTVCIWVNSPANPTGMVLDIENLEKLVDFAKKNGIWLIYDNAYSEITFEGYRAPSIFQIKGALDVAIEIGSFSKSHSFAGYRMGWVVGNAYLIDALKKVKSQFDSGMSRPLQKLAAYALNNPDEKWRKAMIESYEDRRDVIIENLKKIGLFADKPKGSLYLWVAIPDGFKDSEEFVFDLLEKRQILLAPGTAFGRNGKRCVRVSICCNVDSIESYFK